MRLVKQTCLEFREGTSDKVYEVDLCEIGPGQFLVNFRYGRRGSVLRDGTKTSAAVSESEATRIFDDLIASKQKKGYTAPGATVPTVEAPFEAAAATNEADPALRTAIIKRLGEGNTSSSTWKLSRAVWKAGVLRLPEAEPYLVGLVGSGDAMLDYSIAWSLGQLATATGVNTLRQLESSGGSPTVRRIAGTGLMERCDAAERSQLVGQCIDQLPESLQSSAVNGPASEFHEALERVLAADPRQSDLLEIIYLINNEYVRPALLRVLRTIALQPPSFQHVRHIFKAAELKRDSAVFSLLAWRFETTKSQFRMPDAWYLKYTKQKKPTLGPAATKAYSHGTRDYLRRRVWHALERWGQANQAADYTRVAANILLQFSDTDAQQPRQHSHHTYDYNTQSNSATVRHFDKWSPYLAFNQILFANSPRYALHSNRKSFICVSPFEPGGDAPTAREEAFPKLWQSQPDVVLNLLLESRCEPVHEFGVKVLRSCRDFCDTVDVAVLKRLLACPYETTLKLTLELAKNKFDPNNPDAQLILAMAHCNYPPARQQAHEWVRTHRTALLADSSFVVELVLSPAADSRLVAREVLRDATPDESQSKVIIARLCAALQDLHEDEDAVAGDTTETMLLVFGPHLSNIGEDIIRDLLGHCLPEVQRFAGDLVLRHETLSKNPPDDILKALLESDDESVRVIGVRIIAQLPDDVLKDSIDLLIDLTRHTQADIRATIRPTIVRLATEDETFGQRIATRLVDSLLISGAADGVPSHTASIIREDLSKHLATISADRVWQLLQSRSPVAQDIGGLLLPTNVNAAELDIAEIVKLSNHQILSVREASWQMLTSELDRAKTEPETTAKVVDSKWPDSRAFAMEFFNTHFAEDGDLPPAVMIALCDSVQPDVRQFGRRLITSQFEDGHGEEYVVKLSEHPSQDMQLFASGFLERHARDNIEQLKQLSPYFVAVLSQVNRGRVAKERALRLLEEEGLKNEPAARVVVEILARISATAAITYKAQTIEIMLRLQTAFPNISTPLTVAPLEVRGGV